MVKTASAPVTSHTVRNTALPRKSLTSRVTWKLVDTP
jgi:hypothetical protein